MIIRVGLLWVGFYGSCLAEVVARENTEQPCGRLTYLGVHKTFLHSLIDFLENLRTHSDPVFLPPKERTELRAEMLEGCACGGLHPDALQ